MTELGRMVHGLLGCGWGRDFATADDMARCAEAAVRIVLLHPPDGSEAAIATIKLCQRHIDRLSLETVPNVGTDA